MKLWIGGIMLVLGSASFVIGFWLKSNTPIQVGPIPTLGGAAVALVGLGLFLAAL
jgi:hypothetical protein